MAFALPGSHPTSAKGPLAPRGRRMQPLQPLRKLATYCSQCQWLMSSPRLMQGASCLKRKPSLLVGYSLMIDLSTLLAQCCKRKLALQLDINKLEKFL